MAMYLGAYLLAVLLLSVKLVAGCGVTGQVYCDKCWDGGYTSSRCSYLKGITVTGTCMIQKGSIIVNFTGTASTDSSGSFLAGFGATTNKLGKSNAESAFMYALYKNSDYTKGRTTDSSVLGCQITISNAPSTCSVFSVNNGVCSTTGGKGNGWYPASHVGLIQYGSSTFADVALGIGGSQSDSLCLKPSTKSSTCPHSPPPPPVSPPPVKASPPPPPVKLHGDPHLVGAHGTHYDFSGLPEQSFCLLTDRSLHINMKMAGYLDPRKESATVFVEDKAVRTWIRELGFIWTVDGVEHKLRLAARIGNQVARGDGYLATAVLDSRTLPVMKPGDVFQGEGGLEVAMKEYETEGPYDVDHYTVSIAKLISMDIRLRVAHPLLQTPNDVYTHFSFSIINVEKSPAIHGVLGQTYRTNREERSARFQKLVAMLHHAVGADSNEGSGFLDGQASDYISTNVLVPDCRYSGYNGRSLPTRVASQ